MSYVVTESGIVQVIKCVQKATYSFIQKKTGHDINGNCLESPIQLFTFYFQLVLPLQYRI